jgi:hypothetical protein
MKIVLLSLCLLTTSLFAARGAPFIPEVDDRFDTAEALIVSNNTAMDTRVDAIEANQAIGSNGIFTVTTTKAAASTFSLGITIPATSLIIGLYVRVKTLVVSADANTLAFGCTSGAGLLAAYDYSGEIANFVKPATTTMPYLTTSTCVITGTVGAGTSGWTAGAVEVYAQYLNLI